MKFIVSQLKAALFPVTDLSATTFVVCLLTLVEDVGRYHSWATVAGVAFLNFLMVRLLCWSLVTSSVLVIDVLRQSLASRGVPGARLPVARQKMGSNMLEKTKPQYESS